MKMKKIQSAVLVAGLAVSLAGLSALAQSSAQAKKAAPAGPSRWDIFAGYSYLAPHGTVSALQPGGMSQDFTYHAVNEGAIGSVAYYFNKYLGAQAEIGAHPDMTNGNSNNFYTYSGGIISRFPMGDITPFVHALVGAADVSGPDHEPLKLGTALTAGGGMDYETPLLNHKLAIRLFQADFMYMHDNWGPVTYGGRANIDAARLSAGLVYHIGSIYTPPVTLACSVNGPSTVFPGEPISLAATATNLNPKKKAAYTWSGDGVSGMDSSAKVNTTNLAPGTYTAKATVSEGNKTGQTADCSTQYTIKQFEPPTVSCSANPTSIQTDGTSTISATGVSPQNRPLTYSYSASAGTVSGSGSSATYSAAGAPSGSATITCTVTDDKGQTATANTSVNIEAPVVPAPKVSSLCSLSFDKDKKRPTRVDNEAKACLDDIALTMQQQSDAKLAIVGNATSAEKTMPKHPKKHMVMVDDAAQRAVNAKDYLVTEQGIDASRISVATGNGDEQSAQDYLVPAGANFSQDVQGTTPVDESTVKPETRKPLPMRHHAAHHTTK